jgi:uncharacterized membrane protein YeaQ/YmgE (transglycosylase-associated protein family)
MLLAIAVFAGLLAGLLRAWLSKRQYEIPQIRHIWLVLIAFLPQWFTFYWSVTRRSIPDQWAVAALIGSQILLLIFIWRNSYQQRYRNRLAFWLLGLGLVFNLTVILLNGGLMPISPASVSRLVPDALPGSWQIGSRLGTGKDIVLAVDQTRLWWLSDRFLLPLPGRDAAFSLGDVFIAAGAFFMLCVWDSTQSDLIPTDGTITSTTQQG